MKMTIKCSRDLNQLSEGQSLGQFLAIKYIKIHSYQNMSIIKVVLLFLYSSMKFFLERFDVKKCL